VSRCGYIIPPNLYPKTHVLKKKIDTPTKKQSSAYIIGGKGKSDILSRVRSITQGGAIVRTRALVRPWNGRDRTPSAHGERANDHPKRCDHSLPQ
jgi:hypothetical protein